MRAFEPRKGAARELVDLALRLGAEHAEAFVQSRSELAAEVERDLLRGAHAAEDAGAAFRVVKAGRVGFSFTADPRGVKRAVRDALQSARHGRPGGGFPPPPRLRTVPGLWDPRATRASPGMLCDALAHALDRAHAVHRGFRAVGGGASVEVERSALANSSGLALEQRGTVSSISLYGVLGRGEGSASTGHDSSASRRLALPPGVGETAARMALAGQKPRRARSGKRRVVLAPEAAADLVEICARALRVEPLQRGQSPFRREPGERVAGSALGLYDDPFLAGGLGSGAVDDDGVPARKHWLVRDGVRVGALASLGDSWRFGLPPTGSAVRPGGGTRGFRGFPVAAGRNLRLDAPRMARGELLDEAGDAVLVHDLLGAHTSNAATGAFQVTSTVCFAVRRGELVHALRPLVLGGSLHGFLAGIRAASREERLLHGSQSAACLRLGSVLVDGMRVAA